MNSIVLALLSAVIAIGPAKQQPDSLALAKLDGMLEKYTSAITGLGTEGKNAECDFLIASSNDSLIVQHVTLWLYDHYKDSPIMGEEAVAIHIYDRWLKDGTVKMRGEFDRFDAELFATFNRSTLLGMKAPRIELRTPKGRKTQMPVDGRYSILFFFDTSCGKCKLTTELMPSSLQKIKFPTCFYAVYCGHDEKAWKKFRKGFKVKNRKVDIVHLWDPDMESDYPRLYGVISTPRLYLTDTDGEIFGRRLEIESLEEIISYINSYYEQAQKH